MCLYVNPRGGGSSRGVCVAARQDKGCGQDMGRVHHGLGGREVMAYTMDKERLLIVGLYSTAAPDTWRNLHSSQVASSFLGLGARRQKVIQLITVVGFHRLDCWIYTRVCPSYGDQLGG